jgi:hypothetical protein
MGELNCGIRLLIADKASPFDAGFLMLDVG